MRNRKKVSWKQIVLRILLLLLAVICIAVLLFSMYLLHMGPFRKAAKTMQLDASVSAQTDPEFLHVEGSKIVNSSGETVQLQGMNLGGWLLSEYWMCPMIEPDSSLPADSINALYNQRILERRFGVEKTQELLDLYQDNWITEWDIQNIASMGCNVIRVPFWYRNFMLDPYGTWIKKDPDKNPGFQRLDWVIRMAKKYGLYVILDLHGCPGGQGTNQCSGSGTMDFYTQPRFQQAAEDLWVAIAKRYRNEPTVAAYDLINEPENPDEDAPVDQRNEIYDRLIKAIRKVDQKHILAVEGIWSLKVLPKPAEQDWDNTIYEIHCYGDNLEEWITESYQYGEYHQIPVYIGEFRNIQMKEVCDRYGLSYTFWTYKGIAWEIGGTEYVKKNWFAYHEPYCFPALVKYDPYWLLKLKWGESISTSNFTRNAWIQKVWGQ